MDMNEDGTIAMNEFITNIIHKAHKAIKNPRLFIYKLKLSRFLPEKTDISWRYYNIFNKKIDFKNPKTFNEKLQWLKLYDHNPQYTQLVDKFEVREYIKKKIGEKYLIPIYGVWEKFEDIDFNSLPNQFVLKCTHDSGSVVICRDKATLNIKNIKLKINKALKKNFYYSSREWPYKNIKPRIISEKFVTDSELSKELTDYKFYCFNGYVDCVMICYDRAIGDTKFYFFDRDWKLKRINKRGISAPRDFSIPKPNCIDEMFYIAEKLSYDIPFVRVDLYQSNDQVYFGEMTFYPSSGFDKNYLPETDLYFGDLIKFDQVKG